MKLALAILAILLVCAAPSLALADALPDCPPGTHMVTNPIPEGAMHHAGGQCVEDEGGASESGGGCSAVRAASGGRVGEVPLALFVLAPAAVLVRRRR
jgi:hypothetical protein